MDVHVKRIADSVSRRSFVGGSDARVIMGQDEKALIRLWQEKRGEVGLAQITKTSACEYSLPLGRKRRALTATHPR